MQRTVPRSSILLHLAIISGLALVLFGCRGSARDEVVSSVSVRGRVTSISKATSGTSVLRLAPKEFLDGESWLDERQRELTCRVLEPDGLAWVLDQLQVGDFVVVSGEKGPLEDGTVGLQRVNSPRPLLMS